jgi:hypothetical protein
MNTVLPGTCTFGRDDLLHPDGPPTVGTSRKTNTSAMISHAARWWAVKELARRAGVTHDFFCSWRIEIRQYSTVIHLQPGTSKQIHFRHLHAENEHSLAGTDFQTIRARWMYPPEEPIRSTIPDLIVPFCERGENNQHPLFWLGRPDLIKCFADLPASTVFTLCRVEESQQGDLDAHSRFTAHMSVAHRDGFLDRPIVDEWGLALGQAIAALLPKWRPKQRILRTKVSHDIDEVGFLPRFRPAGFNGNTRLLVRTGWMFLPFDLRRAIKLSVVHRDPIRGTAHLLRTLAPGHPTCLGLVHTVVSAALQRNLDTAVYWKASQLGPFDSGYDPRDRKIRNVISWLQGRSVENGIHPGYRTFRCPETLQEEVQIVRAVLGEHRLGGRQHYLRWCPETWLDWENCGLAYDSTVGYSDHVGFRAGTCIPYRPWLWSLDREARLLEIPLIVMDSSLLDSMELRRDDLLQVVRRLIDRCRVVGGVFTFLCHNTTLRDVSFVRDYEQILDMLTPSNRFDWTSSSTNDWL